MENKQNFLYDLKELIACPSVLSEAKEGMPFGEGVYKAYQYFMNLAKSMGFETVNYDNYIGEVVFGEGEEIGIIGHLDVVPVGDGWNTPPFTLTERKGVYYGRGIADDKAPLLAVLYILKELKDNGITPTKKFRLFVGCDEESGWNDIRHFEKEHKFPEYGFSPDGNFPVSFAEKGINRITFSLPKFKRFKGIKGGTVFNAVCGLAEVAHQDAIDLDLVEKYGLTVQGNKIISVGKSCHGSRPELGKNAILPLFEYMRDMGEDLQNAIDFLFKDKWSFGGIDTEQGRVTFSPNIIEEDGEGVKIYCDMRIPYPYRLKDFIPSFESSGISFEANKVRDPLFIDKNSKLVQTLLTSYRSKFDKTAQPIYQCGGTFAYVFEKGCAFGPEFPDKPSTIHEANECLSDEDLERIYDIYKTAIFELASTDGLK